MSEILSSNFLSFLIIFLACGVLVYRSRFLHSRKFFHLSLLQILYIVLLPGVIFILSFLYMKSIFVRPVSDMVWLPDKTLEIIILISLFFTYGGLVIHSITKMLSETELRYAGGEAAKLNKFFHLNFSHNLIYSGGIVVISGLTLAEMNHAPVLLYEKMLPPVVRGLITGALALWSMREYTRSQDQYSGRWADLKAVFIITWVGIIAIFYGFLEADGGIKEYQMFLPAVSALGMLAVFNIYLGVRFLRRRRKLTLDRDNQG